MKKQEFKELFNKKDDISAKKVSNILTEYCNTTKNEDTLACINTMETLLNVKWLMESVKDSYDFKEPYTIQDGYDLLRMKVIRNYIESLED